MAEKVIIARDCDWCAEHGVETVATQEHQASADGEPTDDVVDLCDACGILLDLIGPRRDFISERLDTLDAMLRRARPRKHRTAPPAIRTALAGRGAPETVSDQLPLPRSLTADHDTSDVRLDSPFIFCIECKPPRRVAASHRDDHASAAHDCTAPEIIWADGTVHLGFACAVHTVCADTGYALATKDQLTAHEATAHFAWSPTPATPEPPQAATAPTKQADKKSTPKKPSNGRWVKDVDQIGCPLPHAKPGAPTPYWVAFAHRNNHASTAHDLRVAEIDWFTKEGDTVTLDHRCTEHTECLGPHGNGLGFPTPESLEMHKRVMRTLGAKREAAV
ncbi:hypothetical protein [Streptomyces sp. CBMA29]|uniref:hypothetical protein n=1 Tax=Streptomyces sp. CBMA29 TaxID=1896314 RepID=UPI001661E273|nr:hypothetical protein [Streptomyces sp. CBMA29]